MTLEASRLTDDIASQELPGGGGGERSGRRASLAARAPKGGVKRESIGRARAFNV